MKNVCNKWGKLFAINWVISYVTFYISGYYFVSKYVQHQSFFFITNPTEFILIAFFATVAAVFCVFLVFVIEGVIFGMNNMKYTISLIVSMIVSVNTSVVFAYIVISITSR